MSVSPRKQGPLEPRLDRPLPLWMIFPLLFIGIYLSHITLLRLPYYWDEAGYYIPAAYDFFRTGSLIPFSTLSNAHPPLPSIYLALWWKASGFMPAVTRTAMCLVTAIALLAVYRLSLLLGSRTQVAAATTLLTAIYPIWFAQSTLAHADMFAAAATLWGLVFTFAALRKIAGDSGRAGGGAALCFAIAALCKETAVITPLAIALWEGGQALRLAGRQRRAHLRFGLFLLSPLVPLLAWYAYHRYRTGYIFGNPQFLHYNVTQALVPLRILSAFKSRVLHVTAHMNMFVAVLCALAAMLLLPLPDRDGTLRPRVSPADQAVLYCVLLANVLFFSCIGGALLTRYLLPLYPLVLLLCVSTFYRRVPFWWALVGLCAAAFLAGLFVNPPYGFAPEDNLDYVAMIRLHQQAIHQILVHFPGRTVLTAWPATDELSKPELGYVKNRVPVVRVENFSLPEIEKAAAFAGDYGVCLAFSTKYEPSYLLPILHSRNADLLPPDRNLGPAAIARLLDGKIFWRSERGGGWAAVLGFDHPQTLPLSTRISDSFRDRNIGSKQTGNRLLPAAE